MAGAIPIIAGVILTMAGVIPITDPIGPVTTVATGMDITGAEEAIIIRHLITPIQREDGVTGMDSVIPGQAIRGMVPGAWIIRKQIMRA